MKLRLVEPPEKLQEPPQRTHLRLVVDRSVEGDAGRRPELDPEPPRAA